MTSSSATATPDYSVYNATSVRHFLDYLLPSAAHWYSAERGDLAYRGQPSGRWLLVPKAFRPGQLAYLYAGRSLPSPPRVVPQSRAEFYAVHQFVKAADTSGLQIAGAGGQLLLQNEPRRIFRDPDWEYNWPQEEIVETLALAQHHGVPTRLLDFSEDPLVAAHFAARFSWDSQKRRRIGGRERRHLAVWVIDLRFVRALNGMDRRYPERIREIHVPRANNSYLHAQYGFFLIDRAANDLMPRGELLSIEGATADRARFWHTGNRLAARGIEQTWFDALPIRQVRLRTVHTAELLIELEKRGITRVGLTPSLDRVVESLEFQRSISS